MRYHDNLVALQEWESEVHSDFLWDKWMVRRLEATLDQDFFQRRHNPLYKVLVSSPQVGQDALDIQVQVFISGEDRVLSFLNQGWRYLRGGLKAEDKPMWLKSREWFVLCAVMDSRVYSAEEIWEKGAMPFQATGFMGLCEFDVERAASQYLFAKGIKVDPEFLSNDPRVV
jgi:hypothetical protein